MRRRSSTTTTSFATASNATFAQDDALPGPPTAADSVRVDQPRMVNPAAVDEVFRYFDGDGDGVWAFEEARAARLKLRSEDLTRPLFMGMCMELAANPAEGWYPQHLLALYQQRPTYWDSSPEADVQRIQALAASDGKSTASEAEHRAGAVVSPARSPPQQHLQRTHTAASSAVPSRTATGQGRPAAPARRGSLDSPPFPPAAETSADALHGAMSGLGTDEDAVYRELSGVRSQAQWDTLQQTFRSRHPTFSGGDLKAALRSELTASELRRAKQTLAANGVEWDTPPPQPQEPAPPPPGSAPPSSAVQPGSASPGTAAQPSASPGSAPPGTSHPYRGGGQPHDGVPVFRSGSQPQTQTRPGTSRPAGSSGQSQPEEPAASASSPPGTQSGFAEQAGSAPESTETGPPRVFTVTAQKRAPSADDAKQLPCDLAELAQVLEAVAHVDRGEESLESLQFLMSQHAEERRMLQQVKERHLAVADTLKSALSYRISERMERAAFDDRAHARRLQLRQGALRHQLELAKQFGAFDGTLDEVVAPHSDPLSPHPAAMQAGRQPVSLPPEPMEPELFHPPATGRPRSPRRGQFRTKLPVDLVQLMEHLSVAASADWTSATCEELKAALHAHRQEHAELLRVIHWHGEVAEGLRSAFQYQLADSMHRMRWEELQEQLRRNRRHAELASARNALGIGGNPPVRPGEVERQRRAEAEAVAERLRSEATDSIKAAQAMAAVAQLSPSSGQQWTRGDRAVSPQRRPEQRPWDGQLLTPGTRVRVSRGADRAVTGTVVTVDRRTQRCVLRVHSDGSTVQVPSAECEPLADVGRRPILYSV